MPKKIRVVLIIVAIVAVFSVYALAQYVHTVANSNQTLQQGTPLPNPDDDPDHDGLSNQQEVIWGTDPFNPDTDGDGFKDGEEVNSGHNPLVPGPNDLLPVSDNSPAANITDNLSTLMVSGFAAGALNTNDPTNYNNALADISSTVLDNGTQALDPNNIQLDPVVTSSNSKADQEKYINTIGFIIENDLWGEMVNEPQQVAAKVVVLSNQASNTDAQKFFQTKTNYYHDILVKINSVPVPPSWSNIHQQLLTTIKGLEIDHKALGQMGDDPMKGMIAMSNLISIYQNVRPILVSIVQKIRDEHLNPLNSQLWSLINSLTNGL